jgi:hypothetical protein
MSQHPKSLYYLFPGSAQATRRRFHIHLAVAFLVGVLSAGIIATVAYFAQ